MTRDDQTYLDKPYLSIRWRGVQQILYAEWKGFATSAEFRAALSTGLQAIRERHVLGDVRPRPPWLSPSPKADSRAR